MKNDVRKMFLAGVFGVVGAVGAQQPGESRPQPPTAPEAKANSAQEANRAQEAGSAQEANRARGDNKPGSAADLQKWIKQLGSDKYRDRLKAERELRKLGSAAVPKLKQAAAESRDSEVQWRARRLLRQIEHGGPGGLVERERANSQEPEGIKQGEPWSPPRGMRRETVRDQFDRLFERFERDFGIDVPRARFFGDGFFRDLEEQMQELRRGNSGGQSQGMNVQIGPDGVRVEVKEVDQDGKSETKVYEAPDLETFRQQYPDLLHSNGLGLGLMPFDGNPSTPFRGRFGDIIREFQSRQAMPQVVPWDAIAPNGVAPQGAAPASPTPPAGKRLGVIVRPIPADVRAYLELAPDAGLMVESVQSDTLAEALGLQRNDIVTRIGKQAIGSAADVQRALGAIERGATVEVEFVRKGRAQTATTKKRESAAAEIR